MRLDDPLPPVDPSDPVAVAVRAIVEAHRRKARRERAQQAEAWERNKDRVIGGRVNPVVILAWAASTGLTVTTAYDEGSFAWAYVRDDKRCTYTVTMHQDGCRIGGTHGGPEGSGATLDEAWAAVKEKEPA